MLQVLTTGAEDYGQYIKALFCGPPGSGKTLISSTFPNPFFASAEGGLMSIWDRSIKHSKIRSSHDLTDVMVMATQDPSVREQMVGAPVETIVIDTIDEIAKILIQERLSEGKKETLAMGDWGWLGDQLRGIVRGFRNLDLHIVFTCHIKSTEDSETGRTYFKPAIQGAMGDEIAGYVDLALLLRANQMTKIENGESKRVTVRLLQTVPDTNHPWIKDRSGKLPVPEFEIDFHTDFDRINSLIFGAKDVDPVKPKKTAPALKVETSVGSSNDTPAAAESKTAESKPLVEQVAEVEAERAETRAKIAVTKNELALMTAKEKMTIQGPCECEECGTVVENLDQQDMAVVKFRMILCNKCYKNAVQAKKG